MTAQVPVIVTETGMNFDKNDISAIAIAEAEKKMRMTIKKLRGQLIGTEKAIEHVNAEIEILGLDAIRVKVKSKLKTIQTGLKVTKIKGLTTDLEESVDTMPFDETSSDHKINRYSISIGLYDKDAKCFSRTIMVESDGFKATQQQTTAMKKYQALEEQKRQFTNDSIDWRKKLSDMPALERQIKATLARRQIESAKGGKELINDLLKNFESNLLMLGE